MGEARDIRGTGGRLGQASQGVDLTVTGILTLPEIDGISRVEGGVLIKKVIGSEEETHPIPHCHRVGNVFCMWDVQKTGCHPGYQVLAGEKNRGWLGWLATASLRSGLCTRP